MPNVSLFTQCYLFLMQWCYKKATDHRKNLISPTLCLYRLDWSRYTPNDRTWELAENVTNAPELVQEFHRCYPDKPSPSSCIATCGTRRQRRG